MAIVADTSYALNAGKSADVDAAVAAATGLRLMGFACKSAAGAAFEIVHGATADGGDAIIPIELAVNTSRTEWFGPGGIPVPNGLSLNRSSGTFDCTLFHNTLP